MNSDLNKAEWYGNETLGIEKTISINKKLMRDKIVIRCKKYGYNENKYLRLLEDTNIESYINPLIENFYKSEDFYNNINNKELVEYLNGVPLSYLKNNIRLLIKDSVTDDNIETLTIFWNLILDSLYVKVTVEQSTLNNLYDKNSYSNVKTLIKHEPISLDTNEMIQTDLYIAFNEISKSMKSEVKSMLNYVRTEKSYPTYFKNYLKKFIEYLEFCDCNEFNQKEIFSRHTVLLRYIILKGELPKQLVNKTYLNKLTNEVNKMCNSETDYIKSNADMLCRLMDDIVTYNIVSNKVKK